MIIIAGNVKAEPYIQVQPIIVALVWRRRWRTRSNSANVLPFLILGNYLDNSVIDQSSTNSASRSATIFILRQDGTGSAEV